MIKGRFKIYNLRAGYDTIYKSSHKKEEDKMNKYIYTAIYTAVSLGIGNLRVQACDLLEPSKFPLLEDKKTHSFKSYEGHSHKEALSQNSVKEDSPIIVNYRDKDIVLSDSRLASLMPNSPRLEVLLEKIPEKVEGIDLGENSLTDKAIHLICNKFFKLPALKWVDLSFNAMTLEGLKEVVNLLNHNKNINYICVAGNPAISIKSNNYFKSLEGYLLKRLVLVSEEKLYADSLNLFLEQHRSYQNGQLIKELREEYEKFYDLKTGKTFADRYLSYNEVEDLDGKKALKIASKMMNMQRYDILKEFCKKAIAKGNGEAARYLALQYDRGHLTDEENGYVKYIKQGRDLKDFQCQKEYIYLKNQGLIDEF